MIAPEIFSAIIVDIAAGEAAYKAVRAHGINDRVFWGQLGADEASAKEYARAKAAGLDRMADDLLQIADECRRGVKTTTKADGSTETIDGDMVDRSRLQVDSRKWLLSKLAPKKYGDRIQTEHSGSVTVHSVDYSKADE